MKLISSTLEETVSKQLIQSTPPVRQAGLQLLNSIQISPGSVGLDRSSTWKISQIEVDANDTFRKYRKFLFQFSAMGLANGTAVTLQIAMRRNGGAKANSYYTTWHAITSATTNVWGASAGSSTILVGPNDLTDNLGLRKVDIWVDQLGFDIATQRLSNTTTTPSYINAIGNFVMSGSTPFYGVDDSCGVILNLSGANFFTSPKYYNTPAYLDMPIYCDIYGLAVK